MAKTASFEESMAELERLTKLLEKNDTPLEDAIKYFEKGTELAGECRKILDKAEQKAVKLIGGKDGEMHEALFDEEDI